MKTVQKSRLFIAVLALLAGLAIAPPAYAGSVGAPARQETQPVFALPGTLSEAVRQPFGTYLTTNVNQRFGSVGNTRSNRLPVSMP